MTKLMESIHVIQVGCEIFQELHLEKECPLKVEVKELRRSTMESLEDPFQTIVEMNKEIEKVKNGLTSFELEARVCIQGELLDDLENVFRKKNI
ncbi:hypothetical protein Tco_0353659 [Tanacetum coccineum]